MSDEQRWLTTRKPQLLAALAYRGAPPRKQRLMLCAFARTCAPLLAVPEWSAAIELAERYADGAGMAADLSAAHRSVRSLELHNTGPAHYHSSSLLVEVTRAIPTLDKHTYGRVYQVHRTPESRAVLCALVRDIFGNPFRPVVFDPAWRTSTAVGLARSMYDARAFAPMPALADALEDAGCTDPDILSHCRGDGPHVRGCWVVDHVLGKTP